MRLCRRLQPFFLFMWQKKSFWRFFRKCIYGITLTHFNESLENIIREHYLLTEYWANKLFFYKIYFNHSLVLRVQSQNTIYCIETYIFSPILLNFDLEINRFSDMFKNTKMVPKFILETRKELDELKIHLNLVKKL